jgi:hypothetical protein
MSMPPPPREPWPPTPPGYPGSPMPPADPLVSPDFSGWWQRGITIVKVAWRPLVILQAIGAVVGLVLRGPAALLQATSIGSFTAANRDARTVDPAKLFAGLGVGFAGQLLAAFVSALVLLAVVRVTIVAATGGQPSVADALRGAVGRLLPLVGWQLLAALITLAGLCACVLPGLYCIAVFTVLPVVVVVERGGVISRCFRLFHGDLGASLARVATIIGIGIGGGLLASAVAGAFVRVSATTITPALVVSTFVVTAFTVAVQGGLAVLLGPLTTLAYADMRARIEPVSAAVLQQEIDR